MSFIDFPWRFSVVPQPEIRTRIWQEVANGGAAAFNLLEPSPSSRTDQPSMRRSAYGWLKEHQEYFVGQTSEARYFCLLREPAGLVSRFQATRTAGFIAF